MASLFINLFGKATDFKTIYDKGAIILDVRSPQEFSTGHIKGAINIPVDQLKSKMAELKQKGKPFITCCRSGARSAMAKSALESAGLEVYNGGAWTSLQKNIQ